MTDPSVSASLSGRPTVLVTDADRGSAVSVIRSLGREGYRVIAAGHQRHCAGFHSRYASDSLSYPSPITDPMAYAETMLDAITSQSIDFVIPVTDETILPLRSVSGRIPAGCVVAMADDEAFHGAANKQATLDLAQQLGVPCPESSLAANLNDATAIADRFGWPVVLKPVSSRSIKQDTVIIHRVRYSSDRVDLEHAMRRFRDADGVLVQELVSGVGCGVEVLAQNGEIRAAFQHQRIREVPVSGGVSSLRESVPLDPQLLDYSARLMKALNWTGLAMIEFKIGAKGPRLMEINGRIWGSLPLAVHSGMNFPGKLLQMHRDGLDPELDTTYRSGVRCRNFGLELRWAAEVLAGGRHKNVPVPPRHHALLAFLALLDPRIHWDIWSPSDPLPGFFSGQHVLAKIGSKIWQSVGGRR